jgi:hypothetical protein
MRLKPLTALALLLAAAPLFAHDMPWTCPGNRKGTYLRDFTLDASSVSRFQECLRAGVRPVRPPKAVLKTTSTGGGGGGSGDPLPYCLLSTNYAVVMTACPAQTCGDFDDDYRLAQETAISICTTEAMVQQPQLSTGGSVLAVFNGPEPFLSGDHHAAYQRSMGGSGICVLCSGEDDPSHD